MDSLKPLGGEPGRLHPQRPLPGLLIVLETPSNFSPMSLLALGISLFVVNSPRYEYQLGHSICDLGQGTSSLGTCFFHHVGSIIPTA